jgi:polysaccharide export outer membrane protein
MTTKTLLLMCALLGIAGCANTVSKLPALPVDTSAAYRLGAGDSLKITVFGEEDLSGIYNVADNGGVVMPLVGNVPAMGLTLPELQHKLIEQLNTNVIKSPDVTIQIAAYRPFFILGEVKNPGSYPYVPDMTVLTAVAIAGGFTFRASEEEVSVTRNYAGAPREARAPRDARLMPGDVVYVSERHF